MVTKLMIIGASMFFAFGLSKFLWNYIGMRQMHHLKEKYFSVILRQEQGWFDANNVYEFSTKVQAQFEQISLGVGDKFGLTLQTISIILLYLSISNSKLENYATVLILYNISSAIPPAFSKDFLEPIIGFFKETTKNTTHKKIKGLTANITKVKSQDL